MSNERLVKEEDDIVVAFDMGSWNCRVGYAEEEEPEFLITSHDWISHLQTTSNNRISDSSEKNRDSLPDVYPIKRGIATDSDVLENFLTYLFEDRLHLESEGHKVAMTESVLSPKGSKECKAQVLFEKLQVGSLSLACEGVLPLFSEGVTSGVNVMVGEGVASVTPIFNELPFPASINRLEFAGQDLTLYLGKLLSEKGYSFNTPDEVECLRKAKEELCFVSKEPLQGRVMPVTKLPDIDDRVMHTPNGTTIELREECMMCPEAMFRPELTGSSLPSIQEVLRDSLMALDPDSRGYLLNKIFVSGESAKFQGFRLRLQDEVNALLPAGVNAVVRPNYNDGLELKSWIGLSIHGCYTYCDQAWISKQEYDEVGPDIVHRKRFGPY